MLSFFKEANISANFIYFCSFNEVQLTLGFILYLGFILHQGTTLNINSIYTKPKEGRKCYSHLFDIHDNEWK